MNDSRAPSEIPKSQLDEISTRWELVNDPTQFVMRYATAIRRYLRAMIGNDHDAEEVCQEFLLQILHRPLEQREPDRGRFRYYLKQAVRNAARSRMRRRTGHQLAPLQLASMTSNEPSSADLEWIDQWRACVLDRAWAALESHERSTAGNAFYMVMRMVADNPDQDSTTLAARVSQRCGRELKVDAFRKQLSRARRMFAGLVIREVSQTLQQPTRDEIELELIELGLMVYVRDHLSAAGEAGVFADDDAITP